VDTTAKSLEELVRELPPDMRSEVRDFAEFLLKKRTHVTEAEFRLDWRGALRELREQYTSTELEHKALEWWRD
jgi:hypothetical protein